MSRRISLLVLALASVAVTACSSVTGPDTSDEAAVRTTAPCGVYNGTGTKSCE
jgi:hypothetical protein